MSNQEALRQYSHSIRNLKKQCRDAGITEQEFKNLYFQSLKSLESKRAVPPQKSFHFIIIYGVVLVLMIVFLYTAYNYKAVYSSVMCNVQEYIYPGLKLLRRITIPLISLFPSLSDYYHETCLIQNPFFTVVDMDCWPCSTVNNVMEIDDPKPVSHQHNNPFMYKTEQQVINLETLKKIYQTNRETFNTESQKVFKNNKYYQTPDEVFDQLTTNEKNFYVWKFHNIKISKLLRQLIPRPKVVPKFGQSTERFIIIDNSEELLPIPDTECNFSFVLVLSGSRDIQLLPAEECRHQCKALKVELKETYLLWYNWWYWRPAVQSFSGNQTFIAQVGSYC